MDQQRARAEFLQSPCRSPEEVAIRCLVLAKDADRAVDGAAIGDPEGDAALDQRREVREGQVGGDWRREFDQEGVGRLVPQRLGQFAQIVERD
jgi:hypothetical protein